MKDMRNNQKQLFSFIRITNEISKIYKNDEKSLETFIHALISKITDPDKCLKLMETWCDD